MRFKVWWKFMPDIGSYFGNMDGDVTIIAVRPFPSQPEIYSASKGYRIKAVFRDAKLKTLRRTTLFVDRLQEEGKISQDTANIVQYYIYRLGLKKGLRARYAARLKPDGKLELIRPDGTPMPEHDAYFLAFSFSPPFSPGVT